jgi:ferrous iron transport protein B
MIEDHAAAINMPVRYAATKLIEKDQITINELHLSENELDILQHIIDEMQEALGTDKDAALADMRYAFIEEIAEQTVHKKSETREQMISVKIDSVLTHKYLALPVFVLIMALVFWLTFGVIGSGLSICSPWASIGSQKLPIRL